ncbi:MAG: F0F1 ATP synthase subunit B [Bacteroidales bacterium]|nr:F0F1 ATP synthase subunit B [Bacteroidales bacterium]
MDLVTPGIGLIFWQVVTFLILLIILKKYAWKPVLNAVKAREERIKGALESAEEAKQEMKQLKADNEIIIKEAKDERNKLLQEARDIKNQMIEDGKNQAGDEAKKIITAAKLQIESEKNAAISEIKELVATLSVEIAEKILTKELDDKKDQQALIKSSLDDLKLN